MSLYAIVLIATGITLTLYAIVIYNGLVSLENNLAQVWANIDGLLMQRHDTLLKLLEVCGPHRTVDRNISQRLMDADACVQSAAQSREVAALGQAETQLRTGLVRLLTIAEGSPEIRGHDQFPRLRERLSALESAITESSATYNAGAQAHNARIEQFPDLVVARLFGFHPKAQMDLRADRMDEIKMNALYAS